MSSEIHVTVPGATEALGFEDTVRLGRAQSNGIVVDHEYVSGEHLELRRTGDDWEVVDIGSTNGTFIDGERITRSSLGAHTAIRLGHPGGPELVVTIPALETGSEATLVVPKGELVSRYLGEEDPEDMSERTRVLRATLQEHREQETRVWSKRMRQMRYVVIALLLFAGGAAGLAWWQGRRVEAQRQAAAELFYTIKGLELDLRRLEATAGPDPSARERQERLEAQYEDLLTTLGIYSDGTPEEVQLIYRTVHRLGESEVTVPREFVDEVLRYISEWNPADLEASLERATAGDYGPTVADILLENGLPREFFYLALQESKLDPEAIGPSTRYGVPKGMWQLIPSTAEAYGLRLGPLQGERQVDPADERHDVARATAAAASYLADIYETDAQASGLLVMAAYNMGEPRLLSMVRSMPESPAERNFWSLIENHGDQIPTETYNYVYRIVSAAVIGQNPELFGFDFEPPFGGAPTVSADDSEN
jgi:membrane-bound lytic murein transglycosylase D